MMFGVCRWIITPGIPGYCWSPTVKRTDNDKWIPVRRSNLKYYDEIDLYYKNRKNGNMLLYKKAGLKFTPEYLKENPFAGSLYIKPLDKQRCLREVQKGFSLDLTHNIIHEGVGKVKEGLVNLVEESLNDPRAGGLEVMSETVETIIEGYAKQPKVIRNLARISHTDYTTAIHSINVMAYTIGYCYFKKMNEMTTMRYGLAALFHDVGKTEIPAEILSAPRRLTDYEFEVIKTHPEKGAEILQENDTAVHCAILGALEHHERMDGNGYPGKSKKISEIGQILAIIDSYEAITNDDRMYRSALDPIKALEVLKVEVEQKRLNPRLFIDFAYSLTATKQSKARDSYLQVLKSWNVDEDIK